MNKLRQLEQELAYSAARSDIECHCVSERHSGRYSGIWYDVGFADEDTAEDTTWIENAVQYLESRRLLRRHPVRNTLVKVLDAT